MKTSGARKRINWKLVAANLAEAREEIERMESVVVRPSKRDEPALNVALAHAYHHLNFAWNARYMRDEQYRRLSDSQFNRSSKFPAAVKAYRVAQAMREKRSG